MKRTPIQASLGFGGIIRTDGRVMRDIPAKDIYRLLEQGDCAFVKNAEAK